MWTKRIEAHAQAMLRREINDTATLQKLRAAKLGKPAHPATTAAFTEFRENRILRAKASGIEYPRACPHCKNTEVIRAGVARDAQRFRCRACDRTFGQSAKALPIRWRLMCHRCGSFDTHNAGPGKSGGRQGYCHLCRLRFTQGGREELDRNGLLLKMRIEMLRLPKDVAAEMQQQAYLDVLEGKGYCWSVELCTPDAWKNTRGEYGEAGSDHPMYRLHNGQAPIEA